MGNICCKKPENDLLNTISSEKDENVIQQDNYPHDSDPAFRNLGKKEKILDTKPLSTENMIEE